MEMKEQKQKQMAQCLLGKELDWLFGQYSGYL